jgi:predicted RNA binding protein YcfA (HicA-like mRNA interferase family)
VSQPLPAVKPKDVPRVLKREGFEVHPVTGSHYVLKHPGRSGIRVTLPWHNRDLKRGTLAAVIDEAGYSIAAFGKLI